MHAEGIMSGELKHGPLAMIDSESTIIMIITRDRLFKVSWLFNYADNLFIVN